ncbi:hypothetical protein EAN04_24675 [Salmonella enterica]|nr:hypothetical protein [Salmonella enterica]
MEISPQELRVRLEPDLKRLIVSQAKDLGMTISEYIRAKFTEELAASSQPKPEPVDPTPSLSIPLQCVPAGSLEIIKCKVKPARTCSRFRKLAAGIEGVTFEDLRDRMMPATAGIYAIEVFVKNKINPGSETEDRTIYSVVGWYEDEGVTYPVGIEVAFVRHFLGKKKRPLGHGGNILYTASPDNFFQIVKSGDVVNEKYGNGLVLLNESAVEGFDKGAFWLTQTSPYATVNEQYQEIVNNVGLINCHATGYE